MIWIVTIDWQVKQVKFGSSEMFDARNVSFSKEEAEAWITEIRGGKA